MTTQGEHTPSPADRGTDEPSGAYRHRRVGPRRVVAWLAVGGVVAAGGWIITRPHPGDWIPGLGPSSKDAAKTPPVFGTPPPRAVTDTENFNVDTYFPAQRPVETAAYKGRRSGARQGQDCAEMLTAGLQDVLRESGCEGYLSASFTGIDKPVLSSVTVLRFADEGAAARAAQALRAKPGAVAFVQDGLLVPAPTPGATAKPGTAPRIDAVRRYVTVTSSRHPQGPAAPATTAPAPPAPTTPGAPVPQPTATVPPEQALDEATRALAHAAGSQFVWT